MDSYRDHPGDYASPVSDNSVIDEVTAAIGDDERRMQVRAYNHWASLLEGRDYPSIEDLDPAKIGDFGPNSILLDFTAGTDDPRTPFIGAAIRSECGLTGDIASIAQVPSRSLLSRLTDHYMQIIANRAPIGFEAEFVNQRGENICYRGILMPFSSDDRSIDFIYGVINWKDAGEPNAPCRSISAALPADPADELPAARTHLAWDDGPLAEPAPEPEAVPEIALDPDAGLADRLSAARATAEAVRSADGRSRAALYRALGLAFDFALEAQRQPDDYAELLEDSGLKAQARAPMTPIVKLVFGIDYDKTRLTEFAAALSFAHRNQVAEHQFGQFLEASPGGLKALVAAERAARRPAPRPDTRGDAARAALRDANPIALAELESSDEFVLVLVRRSSADGYQAVAAIDDPAMLERAIRRTAG